LDGARERLDELDAVYPSGQRCRVELRSLAVEWRSWIAEPREQNRLRSTEVEIIIRRIRPDDAMRWRAIRLRALQSDPLSFGDTVAAAVQRPESTWIERAHVYATSDNQAVLLGSRGDADVALGAVVRDDARRELFRLYSFWVAPEDRRSGLGSRLLRELETWAHAHGGAILQLFVSDMATPARRLYERAGFADNGRTESSPHAGVTEHGMTKML
jgi:ribosomal protein S18 acetylase RimI-like enzyme